MLFSLLLATLDRTNEMRPLLESLAAQTCQDFELIIIDQNSDDRLTGLMQTYQTRFEIRHVRCSRGHSRALNFGLAYASGDIVAFPDDDCWYDRDLLARVATELCRHLQVSAITGREIVEPEFVTGSRWDRVEGAVTPRNIWRRAITFTIFARRTAVAAFRFDESLGVGAGTQWGAGEETDYLLQLIRAGHAVHYDPSLTVWHQGRSGKFTGVVYAKAFHYAKGIGRVLRINRYPIYEVAYHLLRPFGGFLLALARGRGKQSLYHWAILRGRATGWSAPPPSIRAEVIAAPYPNRGANV